MTQEERDLMIEIARCKGNGCCSKIRNAQSDHNVFHLPEPWNGHLSCSDILFVGTNPNYNAKEVDFPQDNHLDAYITDFFDKRFERYKESKHDNNFYNSILTCANWILNNGDDSKRSFELFDRIASTELVHCKLHNSEGVDDCIDYCYERWFKKIIGNFNGKYVVLIGQKAREYHRLIQYLQSLGKTVVCTTYSTGFRNIKNADRKADILRQLKTKFNILRGAKQMKNDLLTKTLDETLEHVLALNETDSESLNLLVAGNEAQGYDGLRTGDIVANWAAKKRDKINYYNFYCPYFKVSTINNIDLLFSDDEVGAMNRQNSVIILKCLDWTNKHSREHFLKLVKDRTVSTLSGEKKLENVLFIVATESDKSRMGCEPLDDDTRKLFKVIKVN